MSRMIHSAKFWTAVLDLVASLVIYFVTKYVNPSAAEDVLTVLGSVQPVILLVIAAWAAEDVAEKMPGKMTVNEAPADQPRQIGFTAQAVGGGVAVAPGDDE